MTDKALKLLGLMRPAGAVEIGADRAAEAARAGKVRALLLASDASEAAVRKAGYALEGKSALNLKLPYTREELSDALGVGDCTMAAITDMGFAEAFVRQLAAEDPESYADAAAVLAERHEKMRRRRSEKGTKGHAKTNGTRRTNR
jgi:ribosomal protein L7Ae-like RNA K-turn-binding protein